MPNHAFLLVFMPTQLLRWLTSLITSSPIHVLQVVPSLSRSAGVSQFVHNMSLGIDEHRVVFDYLHHATLNGKPLRDCTYDQELIAHGSRVYTVSFASAGLGQFIKEVEEFFVKHGREYDIVHCHMPNSAFCVLREAKHAGIEHRVLHSHLNSSSDNVLHRVRNAPLIAWGKRYATDGVACSDEAGRYLFGNKPFAVMKNGIVLSNYAYDDSSNASLRAELCIGNSDPVIGSVGRFVKQKNFEFGVKVFAELKRSIPNVKWVILGAGDGMDRVRAIAKELGVNESVVMPGVRVDVARFYSLFDVFFMPSLYEGLPVSAVEAQASGLRCVFSTGVPEESDITGESRFVGLNEPYAVWASALADAMSVGRDSGAVEKLTSAGYSAAANAKKLMEFYEGLVAQR